jgi:hypothetical protein
MVRLLFWLRFCCLILASLWIVRFSEQVPVELPLLMDYDGKVSTDWKIYVYPSRYLVDHQGNYATHTWEHSNGIQRKL